MFPRNVSYKGNTALAFKSQRLGVGIIVFDLAMGAWNFSCT